MRERNQTIKWENGSNRIGEFDVSADNSTPIVLRGSFSATDVGSSRTSSISSYVPNSVTNWGIPFSSRFGSKSKTRKGWSLALLKSDKFNGSKSLLPGDSLPNSSNDEGHPNQKPNDSNMNFDNFGSNSLLIEGCSALELQHLHHVNGGIGFANDRCTFDMLLKKESTRQIPSYRLKLDAVSQVVMGIDPYKEGGPFYQAFQHLRTYFLSNETSESSIDGVCYDLVLTMYSCASYLQLVSNSIIKCSLDGEHYRPNHHADYSKRIFKVLAHTMHLLEQLSYETDAFQELDSRMMELHGTGYMFICTRMILPNINSFDKQFTTATPLTRIRDIAHRNDIPADLKHEIKTTLQNKLHACASPDDYQRALEIRKKIQLLNNEDLEYQYRLFLKELSEFFNGTNLLERVAKLEEDLMLNNNFRDGNNTLFTEEDNAKTAKYLKVIRYGCASLNTGQTSSLSLKNPHGDHLGLANELCRHVIDLVEARDWMKQICLKLSSFHFSKRASKFSNNAITPRNDSKTINSSTEVLNLKEQTEQMNNANAIIDNVNNSNITSFSSTSPSVMSSSSPPSCNVNKDMEEESLILLNELYNVDLGLDTQVFAILSALHDLLCRYKCENEEELLKVGVKAIRGTLQHVGLSGICPKTSLNLAEDFTKWIDTYEAVDKENLLLHCDNLTFLSALLDKVRQIVDSFTNATMRLIDTQRLMLEKGVQMDEKAATVLIEGQIRSSLPYQLSKFATLLSKLVKGHMRESIDVIFPGRPHGYLIFVNSLNFTRNDSVFTSPDTDKIAELQPDPETNTVPLLLWVGNIAGDEDLDSLNNHIKRYVEAHKTTTNTGGCEGMTLPTFRVTGLLCSHSLALLSHVGVRARATKMPFGAMSYSMVELVQPNAKRLAGRYVCADLSGESPSDSLIVPYRASPQITPSSMNSSTTQNSVGSKTNPQSTRTESYNNNFLPTNNIRAVDNNDLQASSLSSATNCLSTTTTSNAVEKAPNTLRRLQDNLLQSDKNLSFARIQSILISINSTQTTTTNSPSQQLLSNSQKKDNLHTAATQDKCSSPSVYLDILPNDNRFLWNADLVGTKAATTQCLTVFQGKNPFTSVPCTVLPYGSIKKLIQQLTVHAKHNSLPTADPLHKLQCSLNGFAGPDITELKREWATDLRHLLLAPVRNYFAPELMRKIADVLIIRQFRPTTLGPLRFMVRSSAEGEDRDSRNVGAGVYDSFQLEVNIVERKKFNEGSKIHDDFYLESKNCDDDSTDFALDDESCARLLTCVFKVYASLYSDKSVRASTHTTSNNMAVFIQPLLANPESCFILHTGKDNIISSIEKNHYKEISHIYIYIQAYTRDPR